MAGVVVSALVVALASSWSHDAAPALVFVFSTLGVFFGLRAIDGVVMRSWESLRLNYQ